MSSKVITRNKNKEIIEKIIFIGFCILIFYPAFLRGLYFERELLPTHIYSFTLSIAWLIFKFKDKKYKIINSPIDIAFLGIVFMYGISIFYGVNTRLAMAEFLKYANYFFVFLIAKDFSKDNKKLKIILNIILLAATGVAILGIGSAIGTFKLNGAYVSNRISSTLQYPNALASLLGAVFTINSGLLLGEQNKILRFLYGASLNILLFTFILTYSRGMWLLLPIFLIIYFIILPRNKRLEYLLVLIGNILITISSSLLFSNKLGQSSLKLWLIFIASTIVMGLYAYVIGLFNNKFKSISLKKVIIITIIGTVLITGITIYVINQTEPLILENNTNENTWKSVIREVKDVEVNTTYELSLEYEGMTNSEKAYFGMVRVYSVNSDNKLDIIKDITIKDGKNLKIEFTTLENTNSLRFYFVNYNSNTSVIYKDSKLKQKKNDVIINIPLKYKYIPESIVSRITSFDTNDNSFQVRLAFYKDSNKIIKDYFIFGTGGGGWQTLYRKYQSFDYISQLTHNFLLQAWIAIGLIGVILFVLLLGFVIYNLYNKLKYNEEVHDKTISLSIYIAILSLIVHSLMDFDLSLGAMSLILWALVGTISNDKEYNTKFYNKGLTKVALIIMLIISTYMSSTLWIGTIYASKGVSASNDKSLENAIKYFEKAVSFDHYKSEYFNDLGTFYDIKFKNSKTKEDLIKALEYKEKALALGKFDPMIKTLNANIYLNIGDIVKAQKLINESIELNPMNIQNYIRKVNLNLSIYKYYLNKKDIEKANKTLDDIILIKDEIKNLNDISPENKKYITDLVDRIGQVQFYFENRNDEEYQIDNLELVYAYYFDLDIDKDDILDSLYISNSNEGNLKYEKVISDNASYIKVTNDGKSYGTININKLNLKHNTSYKVYFKGRGTVEKEKIKLLVRDNKSSQNIQGNLSDIELSKDWKLFSTEFTTTNDVEAGNQYLQFILNESDDKYIEIEEVVIFEEK